MSNHYYGKQRGRKIGWATRICNVVVNTVLGPLVRVMDETVGKSLNSYTGSSIYN